MNRHSFPLLASAILLLALPVSADDTKTNQPGDKMTPQTRMLVMRDLMAEHVFAPLHYADGYTRAWRSRMEC